MIRLAATIGVLALAVGGCGETRSGAGSTLTTATTRSSAAGSTTTVTRPPISEPTRETELSASVASALGVLVAPYDAKLLPGTTTTRVGTVTLQLSNVGTLNDHYTLTAEPVGAATIEPATLEVNHGESSPVVVGVKTPGDVIIHAFSTGRGADVADTTIHVTS